MKTYFVYIMASASRARHTGVTSNLEKRVLQHREKAFGGFTARCNVGRLVHYEPFGDIRAAIAREKQIKSWGRAKKVALIESTNRDWKDLSEGWYGKRRAGRAQRLPDTLNGPSFLTGRHSVRKPICMSFRTERSGVRNLALILAPKDGRHVLTEKRQRPERDFSLRCAALGMTWLIVG